MVELNLMLPDGLKRWIDGQVAEGEFADASDYLRELVRRDQERIERQSWLQSEIDKGLASGIDPRPVTAIFNDIRAKYAAGRG